MGTKRDKLIRLLSKNGHSFISGQELSEQLDISRTAIWKHINELKKDGYEFESAPKKGYRLTYIPESYNESTLKWGLNTNWLGRVLYFHETVDSTQNIAHNLAKKQAPHGTVVIANEQKSGRGRLERPFESNSGGIWMSVILRPQMAPHQAAQITLFTSVVIAEALSELTGLTIKVKWPNDLYLNDKKLCGILTEMNGELDSINYLIIGIGINVNQKENQFSNHLREKATSINIASNATWNRAEIVQKILTALEVNYEQYMNKGFSTYKEKWTSMAYKINESITIQTPQQNYSAILKGIDDNGALLIKQGSKIVPLYSGEIIW